MWRTVLPNEENAIIEMCRDLNREDPGPKPVPEAHTLRTLEELRKNPLRGGALVLEADGGIAGYAFLISFWSNELGGEICVLDEFYVRPNHRGQGYGTLLIQGLLQKSPLWPRAYVAVDLEVTPQNLRSRAFYSKMGFLPAKNTHMRYRF